MSARIAMFRNARDRKEEQRLPGRDWVMAMVWICVVGMCVGFWVGVVFTIVAVAR
jgi:hypothetical protein